MRPFANFVHARFTNTRRLARNDRPRKEKKIHENLDPTTLRTARAPVGRGRSWTGHFAQSLVPSLWSPLEAGVNWGGPNVEDSRCLLLKSSQPSPPAPRGPIHS